MSDLRPRLRLVESVGVALEGLREHWLRSLLTVLGVAVGVSVVVTVAALVTGIRSSIISGLEASGPRNFTVTRFDLSAVRLESDEAERIPWWTRERLRPEDAEVLARLPSVDEALYNVRMSASIDFEGHRVTGVPLQGYSSGWPAYNPGAFVAGRNFVPAEVREARSVVVLTTDLAEEVFGARDPVGRSVGIRGPFRGVREPFTVVGVYEPAENIFSEEEGVELAVVPWTTARKRLKAARAEGLVLVVPADSVSQRRAMADVTGRLRALRGLGPLDDNDFSLIRSDQLVEIFNQFTAVFFLVMLALSSVGLLVGGVGVIGIMLISVTERTREIGIRKTVGATQQEILWQFLIEASVLTVSGGAIGLAAGALFAELVERHSPVPAVIPAWSVVAALAMALVTGILFGLLPAHRASRLDPTEALGHE